MKWYVGAAVILVAATTLGVIFAPGRLPIAIILLVMVAIATLVNRVYTWRRRAQRQDKARAYRDQALAMFGNVAHPPPRFSAQPPRPIVNPRQRTPPNSNVPRAACPHCHRQITINKNGRLRVHTNYDPGGAANCPGSGWKFAEFIIHENPYA